MRRVVAAVLTVAVVMATASSAVAASVEREIPQQWRSYWVDSFHQGIYTAAQVDKLVADARAANVNALIVQVGRWADCYCNRSSFPRTHSPIAPAPYDPLDHVIRQAHAAGIELHAWVNATPIWNTAKPPPQPDHIFHTHGHTATGANRWLNKRADGAEIGGATMRSLDVANPAAVDYYVNGIGSIAREYDVDGIHLDYIRYPDHNTDPTHSDWGYSDVSLARFRAATGRTDRPAPGDPQFSHWRRSQVTNYVRKIYLTLHAINPGLRLSHSAIAYGHGPQRVGGWPKTRTYAEVNQDWKGWLAEGIMDLSIAMNYKRESQPDQSQMFEEWSEFVADSQGARAAAVGPAAYLNSVADSVRQARKALAPSAAGNSGAGWSGYSYATPSAAAGSDPRLADAERGKLVTGLTVADPSGAPPVFAEKANVPAMPWKSQPTKGHIAGKLRLGDGTSLDQVPIRLTHVRTGEQVTGRLTDGSGWFGFVDLTPGFWLVKAELPQGVDGRAVDVVEVRPGKVAVPKLFPRVRRCNLVSASISAASRAETRCPVG